MTVHYSRQFQVDWVFLFLFLVNWVDFYWVLYKHINKYIYGHFAFYTYCKVGFFVRFKKYHTQPKLDNTQRTRIFPFGQGS
jgi:hypothetical protein